MTELISLREAAARGIDRVRLPIWANPFDHLKLDIFGDGLLGPWVHLYAPFNKTCNGRDPVDILWAIGAGPQRSGTIPDVDTNAKSFEPYTGPLPDSDEYRREIKRFDRAG